jgi:hypothetical protein
MFDEWLGDRLRSVVFERCEAMISMTSMSLPPSEIRLDQATIDVRTYHMIPMSIGQETCGTKSTEWIVNCILFFRLMICLMMGEADVDHGEGKLGGHHPDTHTGTRFLKIHHLKQSDILISSDDTDLDCLIECLVAMDEDEFLSFVLYLKIAVIKRKLFESLGIS